MKKLFLVLFKITLVITLMAITTIGAAILIHKQQIIVSVTTDMQIAYLALTLLAASLLSALAGALSAMTITLIAYLLCYQLASALMFRHEALGAFFERAYWWLQEAFESKNEDSAEKRKLMFFLNSITCLGVCLILNITSLIAPSLFQVPSWTVGFVCGAWLMTLGTIINSYWKQALAYFRKATAEA